ncbi:MAG TPA: hypothetical protein VE954_15020 [Oligoflexus sp.]|uniref:hypothetical protein n=1 Tax=Oligoflexus sp. TaxID=1971216 RepID=UPI002D3D8F07|nr:hypothetical protein [Oligoflexus sp.]HYX34414.1 hypothetical protein [Oligoflexus sp.]
MAFGAKKTTEQLILENDQADLSKASYSPDLSYTDLDAETDTFSVTVDRVHFRKPLEIVLAVLEANGYASNFENLLSCFDSMVHSVRIRAADRSGTEAVTARNFIPSLSFQLPSKSKVGFLLKKFYAEIEAYELDIARLRAGEQDEAGNKKQSREQLKRDLERLQTENAKLLSNVALLTEQLAQAMKSQAHVTKALESNNIIPPQLKPVLVRELSLQERTVTMKAGRTTYTIPIFFLRTMPKIGDPCFLNIKDDQIVDVYFYENPGREFHSEMAEVLYVSEDSCKLRDSHRKTMIWQVKHPQEAQVFTQLKRGDKAILSSIDNVIVKLSLVVDQNTDRWSQFVLEKQTVFQLEMDRKGDSAALPLFEKKD